MYNRADTYDPGQIMYYRADASDTGQIHLFDATLKATITGNLHSSISTAAPKAILLPMQTDRTYNMPNNMPKKDVESGK